MKTIHKFYKTILLLILAFNFLEVYSQTPNGPKPDWIRVDHAPIQWDYDINMNRIIPPLLQTQDGSSD